MNMKTNPNFSQTDPFFAGIYDLVAFPDNMAAFYVEEVWSVLWVAFVNTVYVRSTI